MVFPAAAVQVAASKYMAAVGVPFAAFVAVTAFLIAVPLGICLALVAGHAGMAIRGELVDPEALEEWNKAGEPGAEGVHCRIRKKARLSDAVEAVWRPSFEKDLGRRMDIRFSINSGTSTRCKSPSEVGGT